MRRPPLAPGECRHCYKPKAEGHEHGMCYPPIANERSYGQPDGEGWSGTTDRLESFVLDITNPHQDTHSGAHGFQVEEAKRITALLREAVVSGDLTYNDFSEGTYAMSETMETVVVDDDNAAHALIGRSIGGVELISFWAGSQTVFFCGPNGSAVGEFRKWGESVEVDALPPATMWVHLDDLPGNKLPGETDAIEGVRVDGDTMAFYGTNWFHLTVVDHQVEVLAPVPVVEAPDEVTVREAAEWLVAIYSPLDFTEPRIAEAWDGLVNALAADRGEAR